VLSADGKMPADFFRQLLLPSVNGIVAWHALALRKKFDQFSFVRWIENSTKKSVSLKVSINIIFWLYFLIERIHNHFFCQTICVFSGLEVGMHGFWF